MAVIQYLYDNFNDGVLDSGHINTFGDTDIVENSGVLKTPAPAGGGVNIKECYSNPIFDLTKGRLAVKMSKTGTTDSNVYVYTGIWDTASKVYAVYGRSNSSNIQNAVNQLGSITETQNDATVGMGPTWTANHWLGWSYVEGTKTLTLARSADGVSWTTSRTIVVNTPASPAFAFRRAGLVLGMANFTAGASNMVTSWDDLSYFATDTALRVKVRFGGSWVNASVKTRVGGAWKRPITRVRSSGNWNRPS